MRRIGKLTGDPSIKMGIPMMVRGAMKRGLLGASALVGVWGAVTAASAQEAAEASQVDDIVVTAQSREQKTIDVPFALTAYSGQFLQDLGVQEFDADPAHCPRTQDVFPGRQSCRNGITGGRAWPGDVTAGRKTGPLE